MTHERILLADDDAMILDVLRYQLEKEGYQVLTAEDGQQALDQAQTGQPDLVLLDVMMPKLQGWEVCRELRRTSEVPILMLTRARRGNGPGAGLRTRRRRLHRQTV